MFRWFFFFFFLQGFGTLDPTNHATSWDIRKHLLEKSTLVVYFVLCNVGGYVFCLGFFCHHFELLLRRKALQGFSMH